MNTNNHPFPNTDIDDDNVPARATVHRPRAMYIPERNLSLKYKSPSFFNAHDRVYSFSGYMRDAITHDIIFPPEDTRVLIFASCPNLINADLWISSLKNLTKIVIMNCPLLKYTPYKLFRLRLDYANIRVVDHDCSGEWEKQINAVAQDIESALIDLIKNNNASYCVQLVLWEELQNLKSRLGIKETGS